MTAPVPPDPRFPVYDPHPHRWTCWPLVIPARVTRTGVSRCIPDPLATMTAVDRVAGALQAVADSAVAVQHHLRSDDLSPHPADRERAARNAGTPASPPATPSSGTSTPRWSTRYSPA